MVTLLSIFILMGKHCNNNITVITITEINNFIIYNNY